MKKALLALFLLLVQISLLSAQTTHSCIAGGVSTTAGVVTQKVIIIYK